jgi:hypothetical protein
LPSNVASVIDRSLLRVFIRGGKYQREKRNLGEYSAAEAAANVSFLVDGVSPLSAGAESSVYIYVYDPLQYRYMSALSHWHVN